MIEVYHLCRDLSSTKSTLDSVATTRYTLLMVNTRVSTRIRQAKVVGKADPTEIVTWVVTFADGAKIRTTEAHGVIKGEKEANYGRVDDLDEQIATLIHVGLEDGYELQQLREAVESE